MARPDQVFHLREAEKELGFAQAVRSGNLLFVAGTCSIGLDNAPVAAGDFEGQLKHIYGLIRRALEAHGASFANVVKEVIYTKDIDALRAALPARAEIYAGAAPPAATWIEVSRFLRADYLLEIEVTAELPPG
jgi:2-iminobutanoate/2-iminopropanoate deaminase